jgi:hypothetical protein
LLLLPRRKGNRGLQDSTLFASLFFHFIFIQMVYNFRGKRGALERWKLFFKPSFRRGLRKEGLEMGFSFFKMEGARVGHVHLHGNDPF